MPAHMVNDKVVSMEEVTMYSILDPYHTHRHVSGMKTVVSP